MELQNLEIMAKLAEFEKAEILVLDGNAYQGKYELNKKSILDYIERDLRNKPMHNPSIDGEIKLARSGKKKLTSWGMNNDTYKKLFAHIPMLTEKAILIASEKPYKPNAHFNNFKHLAIGIEIDNKPYTVHIILGENEGIWYYSHILTDIDKNSLIQQIKKGNDPTVHRQTNGGHPDTASLSNIKDTTLLRLLQAEFVFYF